MNNLTNKLSYRYSGKGELDSEAKKQAKEAKRIFNNYFKKNNVNVNITSSFGITPESDEENLINDFMFFPLKKVFYFDGSKKLIVGVRVAFVKKLKKKKHAVGLADVKLSDIENVEWLMKIGLGKEFKIKNKKLFEGIYGNYLIPFKKILEKDLPNSSRIVYTDQVGWIEGAKTWKYIPFSLPNANDLIYDNKVAKKYKIKTKEELDIKDLYQSTLNLLEIADKRITLPLFAYLCLSLVTSLLKYDFSLQKFMICLSGSTNGISKEGYANIFCNLYDRRNNINSINSQFHSNLNCTEEELRGKALNIRDGVFIVKAENSNKKVQMSKKLLKNEQIKNLILLINQDPINQDFILNINVSGSKANVERIKESSADPLLLPSIVEVFIEYISKLLHTYGQKKLRKKFLSIYEENQKLFNNDGLECDINKVHMYSLLLMSLKVFLSFCRESGVTNGEHIEIYSEAVELFKAESKLNITNEPSTEKKLVSPENLFLQNLLDLLTISPPIPDELRNSPTHDNDNTLGWMLDENKVQIRSKVFENIDIMLKASGKSENFQKKKRQIYMELYNNGIVLPPDDKVIDKVQVGTIEKVIGVSGKSTKVFVIDYQKANEFIKSKKVLGF